MTKLCNTCNQRKPISNFHKRAASKDGLNASCKLCVKYSKRRQQLGITKKEKAQKPYITSKKCSSCGVIRAIHEFHKNSSMLDGHRSNCKQCKKIADSDWRKNNQHRKNSCNSARRAKQQKATPKWVDSVHKSKIFMLYKIAKILSEFTGNLYHVDHIMPLNHRHCSGLHVWWNLRVLPAKENMKKSNNLPDKEYWLYSKKEA